MTRMAQQVDVRRQLRARFDAPRDTLSSRRIVIWHDADGAFEADFDSIASSGLGTARDILCKKVQEGGAWELKYQVSRQHAQDDILIYTRQQKDLSARGLENNWLADIELISEHFQADFASMLMDTLGAKDSAIEGVEEYRTFFKAKDRIERFKRLMPAAQTRQDIILGVIGTTLGAKDLTTECLVRTYLCQLFNQDEPLEALRKYGADEAWKTFIDRRLGYTKDLTDLDELAAHLLITALAFQLPSESLNGLDDRISAPHEQFCLNIVHAWMQDETTRDVLYELCRRVEDLCHLERRFEQLGALQIIDADVFPSINERILVDLFTSMSQGADRAKDAATAIQRRKDMRWFSRVRPYFDALDAAVAVQRFYSEHAQGFHYAVSADIWNAYTNKELGWYRMDAAYRAFCKAVDACQKIKSDLPLPLVDALDNLATWMEHIYVNWFLTESNSCWVNASEKDWSKTGYVEGVPRQRRFFDESVISGSSDVKKTMVIISDALRYEVAAELADRLEGDTKGTATLKSMQSVFPSITEFGMAALLPHTSLSYGWSDGVVYANGEMPTTSTANREAVLRARKPNGRCIQAGDLIAAKRTEYKDLVGNAEYVYVYHNKIDAIGEGLTTENMVFEACDTAIEEIIALVKIATNYLSFNRIVITADHGFLYTRHPLGECDKVSEAEIDANTMKIGRRYAIADKPLEDKLFIEMNMDDIDGGSYTGLAPRECIRIKRPGAGVDYVHGGVSLQECCVPVIHFRNKRAGTKGYEERTPATLQLLSTQRRITSTLFRIELFQKECVGGKVLPAEYELYLTDDSGNEVSDIRKAHADMTNPDGTQRRSCIQFSLNAGKEYNSKKPYFLICKNKENGQIAWKEEYQINVSFVPVEDFGF